MPTRDAEIIVETAVKLRALYPDVPALSILDAVLQKVDTRVRSAVTGPASRPWLQPPCAFAAVLLQAFGPDLSRVEFACAGERDAMLSPAFLNGWARVVEQFQARYA